MNIGTFVVFNELSLARAANLQQALSWIAGLADIAGALIRVGFKRIRIGQDFAVFGLTEERPMNEVIYELRKLPGVDLDAFKALTQLLKAPYIDDHDQDAVTDLFLSESVVIVAGRECERADGALVAWASNTSLISLATDPIWDCNEVQCVLRTRGERRLDHASSFRHVCAPSFIASASRANFVDEVAPTPDKPFPEKLLPLVELLLENHWPDHEAQIRTAGQGGKEALIAEIGQGVAAALGFDYSVELSAKNRSNNHLRQIYLRGSGHGRVHLSIDFETGGFEVCDHSGDHYGEWSFAGTKRKGASSDHSIGL